MQNKVKRVVLGMSGGVDSSISLVLLKKAGFDPIGVSLVYPTWLGCKRNNSCCTKESLDNAQRVCKHLDCRHVVIDASSEFNTEVINYFKDSLKKNITPSPCVFCNPCVKFNKLLQYADKVKADFIATGHYARVRKKGGHYELLRALDKVKDQTYSLSFLKQEHLSRCIFPLGSFKKQEVINIARGMKELAFYNKIKQSQDFCFLGKGELSGFIKTEIKPKEGDIFDERGERIGSHKGLAYYTIGQRGGIGLPGGPYFVLKKDESKNRLIVTKEKKLVFSREIILEPFNIISGKKPLKSFRVKAMVRSSSRPSPATVLPSKSRLVLVFDKEEFAPTPGQVAVFYSRNVCLGGGVIN